MAHYEMESKMTPRHIADLLYRHRPSDRRVLQDMPIADLRKGIALARKLCNSDVCCNYRIDIAEMWVDKWEMER